MANHPHHENPDPTPAQVHAHAAAARARKLADAKAIGIDDKFISNLVDEFYARIRSDAMLGPIFDERIKDWDLHLARMKRFWRSILHNSGEYSGNPMEKHISIPGLDQTHFVHWLNLFYETLRDLERDPLASRLIGKRARMIADSLLTGMSVQKDGMKSAKAGAGLPEL